MTEEGAIFRLPFGDTPLVMYFPLVGQPQLPMVPATPKCISLGTKPLGDIQGLSYSIHRSESKDYLT